MVIEALARVPPSVRDAMIVLLVGGHGPEEVEYVARLEAMIGEAGLEHVVRLVGRREDVPDLMEASDIAIHASLIPEPFGLVVLEAMLHGCAVVAANEGGPAEMLGQSTGLTFDARRPEELAAHPRDARREPGAEERDMVARAESERRISTCIDM